MKHSSLGYHTFSIVKKLTVEEAWTLYRDFKKYENETGNIRVRPSKKFKVNPNADDFTKRLNSSMPIYHIIEYPGEYKGLRWELRLSKKSPAYIDNYSNEDMPCSIKTKINPKVLAGIIDYLTAADESCLKDVETNFDLEASKISPILGKFSLYGLSRIDYCVNFDLKELDIGCSPELMMLLIKRAYIPSFFVEYMKYDSEKSHRMKPQKNSFYLKNNSVNINCYMKFYQLQNEFPECPDIEDAKNIVRFEVQCKYPKVSALSKSIKKGSKQSENILSKMFSKATCITIIDKYFNKVIKAGRYYSLEEARKIVESNGFSPKKEERIINTLNQINAKRGISKAKNRLQPEEQEQFRQSLRVLSDIGVNPVTIPKEYGIKKIPNLLDAYFDKVSDEQVEREIGQWRKSLLFETA